MPRVVRNGEAVWEGSLSRGGGRLSGRSTAFGQVPYSLPSRIGESRGETSPEELLAAAHAGCFTMGLAGELSARGTPPTRLQTTAAVTLDEVPGKGHQIVSSALRTVCAVTGLTQAELEDAASVADDECPLSMLIRGTAEVTVEAVLEIEGGSG